VLDATRDCAYPTGDQKESCEDHPNDQHCRETPRRNLLGQEHRSLNTPTEQVEGDKEYQTYWGSY